MSDRTSETAPARVQTRDRGTAQRERQLEMAEKISHVGSWEWLASTNAVTWSDELYRIYGLEPRSVEITFESFLARVHPDDRARIQREVRSALERGGRFAYQERVVRPDGSVRDLDTIGEALLDADGRTIGLVGTCRDTTDERKRDATIRLYASIVQNVQIGITVWEIDPSSSGDPRLLAFNPAAEAASGGIGPDRWIGRSIREIFPNLRSFELLDTMLAVAREGVVHDIPSLPTRPAADSPAFSAKVFPLPGSAVGVAVEDITVEARARKLRAGEQQVLEMIASHAGLNETLTTLVLMIEEQAPRAMGSVLLLDENGRIRHGAAPNLPSDYNRWVDGQPIGPRAGSCGTAAFRRAPVFVQDIATDPLWAEYRDWALACGLRACWSTPILANDGAVLGTFAFYYRETKLPSERETGLIARATRLAGIAIQRKKTDEQLRALTAHIEAVREEERSSMAREIHDELGQALTALKMDVAWLMRRLHDPNARTQEAFLEKLVSMAGMTDGIIEQVRRISAELRPGVLDDLGLVPAIEWQAQQFEARSGVTCVVDTDVGDTRFEGTLSTAVFRIFQEALTNIARHARATHVDVRLRCERGRLRLEVHDDGIGIAADAASKPMSLGLLGMRERAARLSGTLSVRAKPERGTALVLELPIEEGGGA